MNKKYGQYVWSHTLNGNYFNKHLLRFGVYRYYLKIDTCAVSLLPETGNPRTVRVKVSFSLPSYLWNGTTQKCRKRAINFKEKKGRPLINITITVYNAVTVLDVKGQNLILKAYIVHWRTTENQIGYINQLLKMEVIPLEKKGKKIITGPLIPSAAFDSTTPAVPRITSSKLVGKVHRRRWARVKAVWLATAFFWNGTRLKGRKRLIILEPWVTKQRGLQS